MNPRRSWWKVPSTLCEDSAGLETTAEGSGPLHHPGRPLRSSEVCRVAPRAHVSGRAPEMSFLSACQAPRLPFKPCYPDAGAEASINQGCAFAPPCDELKYNASDPLGFQNFTGRCSGRFPVLVSIVDVLAVPSDLPAGEYVLGFRYDSEMTAQVWQSCADVTIIGA